MLLYTEKRMQLENRKRYPTLLFTLKESNTLVRISDMFDNELRPIESHKVEVVSLTYLNYLFIVMKARKILW